MALCVAFLMYVVIGIADVDSFSDNFFYPNTWQTRYDYHMFPFGDEVGDEKIESGFPVIRDAYRKPFDQVKIFLDGHLELENKARNPRYTPFIAPYHLPYSEVTSGTVWFRETHDDDDLHEVREQINSAFPDNGLEEGPDGMLVVTWQFNQVKTKYPECDPNSRKDYQEFCDCVEEQPVDYLWCECIYLIAPVENNHEICSCHYGSTPNYRYCFCDIYQSRFAYDWTRHCACDARGKSWDASSCATQYFGYSHYLPKIDACDFCACTDERLGYCRCRHITSYMDLGDLKCFLLHAAGKGGCIEQLHLDGVCSKDSRTQCQVESDAIANPANCECILPATLSEGEMMSCLLGYNYHDYIWLCDESNSDLDYCTCIKNRTPGNLDDEIFCKCYASDQDLCVCLSTNGYDGVEDCSDRKRSIPSISNDNSINKRYVQDLSYLNLFQAAIVYNEFQTFVMFTYEKLKYVDTHGITKLSYTDGTTDAVSYTDGTTDAVSYVHPYPGDPMVRHFLLFDSNMGVEGAWLYKLDRAISQPDWTPKV